MLALAAWRRARCEGCGGDVNETFTHDDYVPLPPLRCHACTAIEINRENSNRPQPAALRWGAVRRGS